jgi:hypothetical protein
MNSPEMKTPRGNSPHTPADSLSRWDRLTGRLLKKWAGGAHPSKSIRERLLSKASRSSRSLNWIERSYWGQYGDPTDYRYYPGVLTPIEARGLSLYSLTLCAIQKPGIITYA